jgi:hypothetical protein
MNYNFMPAIIQHNTLSITTASYTFLAGTGRNTNRNINFFEISGAFAALVHALLTKSDLYGLLNSTRSNITLPLINYIRTNRTTGTTYTRWSSDGFC